MKNIIVLSMSLILLASMFLGCSSRSAITIEDNPFTSNRNLRVNSNVKTANFGISIVFGFYFGFSFGGDRIDSISIYDQSDSLLWKIVAKEIVKAGSVEIKYGSCPGNYTQAFPPDNKDPKSLINGQKYQLEASLEGVIIKRNFFYYPSTIYLVPDAKLDSLTMKGK
jgi:hypothetical protein